jgi:hypothetical protein
MRNRHDSRRLLYLGFPALVLVLAALALSVTSTALAEDPIIELGPLGIGGTTLSGSASDDPSASVCVGDDQLDLDLLGSGLVVPTESLCAASGGGTTSVTSPSGSTGATGATGASGASGAAGSAGASGASGAAGTVSAAQAVGLRIVRVRTNLNRVRATKRFRMVVTVRDRQGRLVSGAVVSAGRVPGRTTAAGVRAVKTDKAGTAQVAVRVKRSHLGKRLQVRVAARTPSARASVLRAVALPKPR